MTYYTKWVEWGAISKFYGEQKTKRSGVRLMNHITEGLSIMEKIGATEDAMRAFCLHPLFQADDDLIKSGMEFIKIYNIRPEVLLLVMEYRNQANAWLSDKIYSQKILNSDNEVVSSWIDSIGHPSAGPLNEVKYMLIADKVQNRKDFLQYHASSHARSRELDLYFKIWLQELGITEEQYEVLSTI